MVGVRLDEDAISSINDLLEIHKNSYPRIDNFSDMLRFVIDIGINELKTSYSKKSLNNDDLDDLNDLEVVSTNLKIGRNDKCPCGSGKKYKYCCGK